MGFRISTNVPSISARRTLNVTNGNRKKVLSELSSGSRITSAADDAAGLAISENLKATIRSARQADRNTNDGISLIQTAEGGLSEISNIVIRLRELAIQSASDTIGEKEREFTDLEFQNLKNEIQRISSATEFNGRKLLNGEGEAIEVQIGTNNIENEDRAIIDPSSINTTLDQLGLDGLAVVSKEEAQDSLEKMDEALNNISGNRAVLGALQNRMLSTSRGLQVTEENLSSAKSRIRDTDYARSTAEMAKLNILSSAGTAVLMQANNFGQGALRLVG